MAAEPAGPPPATAGLGSGRLRGVDAARGTALIGMMSVHVMPASTDGRVSVAYLISSGRAAALFAVLAGVGIALASGGRTPLRGPDLARSRRAIAGRAAVVGIVGLVLGAVPNPVAVILPYYGLLFLAALPVLGWPARRLGVAAAVWVLAAPAVSHLLRDPLSYTPGANLSWLDLLDPARFVRTVLLTGYYPVLTWVAYLLAGMAVGRTALASPRVAGRLLVAGAAAAAAAWAFGRLAVARAGGYEGLAGTLLPGTTPGEVELSLRTSLYGTSPTTSWWWEGVAAPHSGTTPDLVHTGGTALAVLGLWLLLQPRLGRFAAPFVAAGSMTLTLYSVHVVALSFGQAAGLGGDDVAGPVLLVHAVLALTFATLWGSPDRRGPLERVSSGAATAAAGPRP